MRKQAINIALSCFAILAGGVIGYLLWVPLASIPIETGGPWLLPLVKVIDPYLSSMGADYVTTAIMVFSLNVPNTVLLSLLAVLAMRLLRRRRWLFYPVFAWPIVVYVAYWVNVWWLKFGAQRLGLPSALDRLPVDVMFPQKIVVIFLTYTLFSLLVLLFDRRFLQPKRAVRLHAGLQAIR